METISMKTLMFLLLKLFVVNARYRSDINTNIISHGELLYFIAKILGTRKMQFILIFSLSYFSLLYFNTDNVKHQSYKYWKPEKGIASRTFPSAHFSQVSMKENSSTKCHNSSSLKQRKIITFIHSRQFHITMTIIHLREIKSK